MRSRALLAAAVAAAAAALAGTAGTAAADGGPLGLSNDVIGSTAGVLGQTAAFSANRGEVEAAGDTGGLLNGHAAPVVNADLRCAVPNPDVQYIGGTLFGGDKAACNTSPVTMSLGDHRVL
ncbi:hypothetical protein MHW47_10040 [Streptomyces sp. OfavH-34-F]|uniref:hypothetical protein n=1 Tax=Streptomyces sp. OfavH-34-F TaxID=2917760 RepID=UPI001EF32A0D|nr:hypothetical protein [Streptomyces sp. OfavH-34-F]MCG7524776.1 hypothetical protein [Streptomyces sp. OfavH-34-F]